MGATTSKQVHQERLSSASTEPNASEQVLKALILGPADTGKSTLFKQVEFAMSRSNSFHEMGERDRIITNFLFNYRKFLIAIKETYGSVSPIKEVNKYSRSYFGDLDKEISATHLVRLRQLSPAIVNFIEIVWKSKYGKAVWKEMNKFPIADSLSYFMRHLKRLSREGYAPTEMDCLRSYSKTTGMFEQIVNLGKGDLSLRLIDFGGSRDERKWDESLPDTHVVFFVVSLSEFDQQLLEDNSVSRQAEAITLFKETFKKEELKDAKFFIVFNKRDVLQKKLRKMRKEDVNLDTVFPDLKLGKDYEEVQKKVEDYFMEKFLEDLSEEEKANVTTMLCSAIRKEDTKIIFREITEIIASEELNV